MAKIFLKELQPHVNLYRDDKTGIAWVENGRAGVAHSCHPSIHGSGSARGMVRRGHWLASDVTVRCNGWIYNVSHLVVSDEYDEIARQNCQCGGNHGEV